MLKKLDEATEKGTFRRYLITMGKWTDTEAYKSLSASKYLIKTFSVANYIDMTSGKPVSIPPTVSFLLETTLSLTPSLTPVPKTIAAHSLTPVPKTIPIPVQPRHHVYFRHGPRLNLNLDPPLKPGSEDKVRKAALQIHSLYGPPNSIVTSPYLRTRQTAQIMSKMFEPPPRVIADVRLSEKLTPRKRTGRGPPGSYNNPTTMYGKLPAVGETELEVKTRITNHLAYMSSDLEETWFVTHGAVIKALVELYGAEVPYYPPSLATLVIPRMNFDQSGFWFQLHYGPKVYTYRRQASGGYIRS